jgi:16S rRNA processing protein RimM
MKKPLVKQGWVCLGVITGAHGIRGAVKLRSFTEDPLDISAYGPLVTEDERSITLRDVKPGAKGLFIGTAQEVTDRTSAETYKGQFLYVLRSALPDDPAAPLRADIPGLEVYDQHRKKLGVVEGVFYNGAHDVLEIRVDKKLILLPFIDDVVLEVTDGCVIVSDMVQEFIDL